MFTNWVCNKFFDGDYDKSEFNTTVRAYLTIGEISAMAGAVVTYGYYTVVSLVKAIKSCREIKIIEEINSLYDDGAPNKYLQKNYLETAKKEIGWFEFISRTIFRFTDKRVNKALEVIQQQAIDSAKLYLKDLGVAIIDNNNDNDNNRDDKSDNNSAILNLASEKVKLKQRIFGRWPQRQMEHQVAFKVDAVQNEV